MARYYASSDSIYERREHLDVEHSKPVNVGQNAAVYRNIGSSFSDCLCISSRLTMINLNLINLYFKIY